MKVFPLLNVSFKSAIICPIISTFFSPIHNQDKSEYHTSQVGKVGYIISGIISKAGIQFDQSITDNEVFGFDRERQRKDE